MNTTNCLLLLLTIQISAQKRQWNTLCIERFSFFFLGLSQTFTFPTADKQKFRFS